MKRGLLIAAIAVVAACSGPRPFVRDGGQGWVDVGYGSDPASALPLAQRHCAQYERVAHLDYAGDNLAHFNCVKP